VAFISHDCYVVLLVAAQGHRHQVPSAGAAGYRVKSATQDSSVPSASTASYGLAQTPQAAAPVHVSVATGTACNPGRRPHMPARQRLHKDQAGSYYYTRLHYPMDSSAAAGSSGKRDYPESKDHSTEPEANDPRGEQRVR
jgi:hypothetical protein